MSQHLIRYCDYCQRQVTMKSRPNLQGLIVPMQTPAGAIELDFHDNNECLPRWFAEKKEEFMASFADEV